MNQRSQILGLAQNKHVSQDTENSRQQPDYTGWNDKIVALEKTT